jgi:hypothetical protein
MVESKVGTKFRFALGFGLMVPYQHLTRDSIVGEWLKSALDLVK